MQLHLQRAEQGLAAGIVPAVSTPVNQARHAVFLGHVPVGIAGTAHQVRLVAGRAEVRHPALHRDQPQAAVLLDEGVLQIDPLAKQAVGFPGLSRSIFTRFNKGPKSSACTRRGNLLR